MDVFQKEDCRMLHGNIESMRQHPFSPSESLSMQEKLSSIRSPNGLGWRAFLIYVRAMNSRNEKSHANVRLTALLFLALVGTSCRPVHLDAVAHGPDPQPAVVLRLLGAATLHRTAEGPLQHFGGISGADRDPATGTWLLLSDDRSEHAPARFYRADIQLGLQGIGRIEVQGAVSLRQADGSTYPGNADPGEVPDPEALRIDPLDGSLVWSSEGDRRRGLSPFVRRADRNGRWLASLSLPPHLKAYPAQERGVRNNLAIEGLAFTPDGSALWVAMEGPLYEDGPVCTAQAGAYTRLLLLDRSGRLLREVAYPLDPLPVPPSGGQRRGDNGVSEILMLDDHRLLVIERSGHETADQVFEFAVRLYEADVRNATDIATMPGLPGQAFTPTSKRLLLDLRLAGSGAGTNVEAAAWGPRLANGHATLLLVSDNNFTPGLATQFMAFEVLPAE
jgi:hypothetical protein